MSNYFVSFVTPNNYLWLAYIMIKSLKHFSKHKIILYCINFDKPKFIDEFDNLICKRINWNLKEKSIFYLKPYIILDSIENMEVKNGIYIEADDIATKKIDELFNECDKNNKIPLCPIHPNEPKNTKSIMNKLNVKKKTMHYVHGHIVFTYNNIDFIKEWYETCIKLGNIKLAWDETILNVLLWKYECSKIIEYIYDPYYKYIFDIDILKKKYGTKINLNKVYMCHGCKNYIESNNILNLLINDKLKI